MWSIAARDENVGSDGHYFRWMLRTVCVHLEAGLVVNEMILPHEHKFGSAAGPDIWFRDKNERPQRSIAVDELLGKNIQRMDWTARFPNT